MLRYFSLVLTCLFLGANIATAQSVHKDYDNVIILEKGDTLKKHLRQDTIEAVDPVTDETHWRYPTTSVFHKLNDAPIYKYAQVKKPARKFLRGDVQKVLDRKLRTDIADAKNFFDQIELIIDKDGNIAYSNISLHDTAMFAQSSAHVDKALRESIKHGIMQKLSKMHFKPAKKDGQPVAYYAVLY